MAHGPCGSINPGSSCMKDRICTKRYPRHFLKETQTGQDGYPLYRHRSSQDRVFTAYISFRRSEVSVDNTWIVPHCPLLTNSSRIGHEPRSAELYQILRLRVRAMPYST
ncbi:hypothetical protein AVEN_127318-1 [Araneus ventricosus]|uniref:Uncharacterized protein n=1 Tax=Araneus ventricosus TaxID=182803 RepID=A0A4Y2IRN0_ARAVE|nr:hypothetical protein AVEN_127318-1 [Araneus ventricosus]